MISCQQIKVVSEKYMNQRHFIKTQRPYLLLKDQKNYLKNNKENMSTKLSLHNLTINPKQNMFMSNVNLNQSFNKFRKFSSLKIERPKSVGSFQIDRNDVKIL
jgi:archaellin